MLWDSRAHVFLTTYETLRQDTEQGVDFVHRFDTVILDEAQKIKNRDAGLSIAVRRMQPTYRWGLSGTPLENRVDDVVSIFDFLKPDLFRRIQPPYSESMVRTRIAPYFLRRRVADVYKELPEKITVERWLHLAEEQREAYEMAYWRGRAELERPGASRIHVFALINTLKQICNLDPASGASVKLDYLSDELRESIGADAKALVFSQFPTKTLREIAPRLSAYGACVFDGSLSDTAREQLMKQFEKEEMPRVLLMSVKAGGLGLTLTRANHVFHFDHWWNPAVARQAEARAHRRGQTQTVFVRDIFTYDTIEERIYDLLVAKQHLFDSVIDDLSTQDVLKKLSDDDLFGLFDLKPPSGASGQQASSKSADRPHEVMAKVRELSPVEFEQLVGRLYSGMGFVTKVTQQSRDSGIDVIARRTSDVGQEHVIIQCKHMPDATIGEPTVRELIGVWSSHREATRAVLVTSGHFSKPAVQLAQDSRIDLVDGVYLAGLILRYST